MGLDSIKTLPQAYFLCVYTQSKLLMSMAKHSVGISALGYSDLTLHRKTRVPKFANCTIEQLEPPQGSRQVSGAGWTAGPFTFQ